MKHYVLVHCSTGTVLNNLHCSEGDIIGCLLPDSFAVDAELYPLPPDAYRWDGSGWVLRPEQPGDHHVWHPTDCVWVPTRTLTDYKNAKRAEINQAREAEFDAPLVTPHGVFDSDPKARTSITDAVLLAQTLQSLGTPTTIDFTLYDNSTVTLDTAGMITVGLMLGQKIQAAHAKSRALKAQIEAATTKEQIDAITWATPSETP